MEGVESQGRLPRTAQARDNRELITRNVYFHIAQVVHSGALDMDVVFGHC
jgi:hypothetical protein